MPLMPSLRRAIFAAQVTAATALVYLTALVAVSNSQVMRSTLGFDPERLWAVAWRGTLSSMDRSSGR